LGETQKRRAAVLAVVGVHVLLGLACTITGIIAMLSVKRLLPDTHADGAVETAEKIRMACAAAPFATSTGYIAVTASFGVAVVESQ
jgi:hypothetical protein